MIELDINQRIQKISKVDAKEQIVTFRVNKPNSELSNAFGIMHGGAIASFVDTTTTAAIYAFD